MDEQGRPMRPRGRSRRWIVSAALVGSGLMAGGVLASTQLAQAQSGSSGSSTTGARSSADVRHGPGETLLTGSVADKVTAAAEEAVPDGTVVRVETDSAGSPYEAHVQKANGNEVTVKIDEGFNVTDIESGGCPNSTRNDGATA